MQPIHLVPRPGTALRFADWVAAVEAHPLLRLAPEYFVTNPATGAKIPQTPRAGDRANLAATHSGAWVDVFFWADDRVSSIPLDPFPALEEPWPDLFRGFSASLSCDIRGNAGELFS